MRAGPGGGRALGPASRSARSERTEPAEALVTTPRALWIWVLLAWLIVAASTDSGRVDLGSQGPRRRWVCAGGGAMPAW